MNSFSLQWEPPPAGLSLAPCCPSSVPAPGACTHPGQGNLSFLEEEPPEWVGAHLQCSHPDLSLGVSGAVRGEQAGQVLTTANHGRRYPKTHNPQPQIHLSFREQWRGPAQEDVISGAFGAGSGSTDKHQEFTWECCSHQTPTHEKPSWDKPQCFDLRQLSHSRSRMHFLLNRGQFPLLFPSENSPLPLISSTSSIRVSLSTLSILDASISTVNQQRGDRIHC